jgi:hypothetical protein
MRTQQREPGSRATAVTTWHSPRAGRFCQAKRGGQGPWQLPLQRPPGCSGSSMAMIGQRHSRHFNRPSRHMQMTQRAPPWRGRRDSRSRNRTLLHNIGWCAGHAGLLFFSSSHTPGPGGGHPPRAFPVRKFAMATWTDSLLPVGCAMPWAPLRPAAGQGGGCEKKRRWVSEGWELGFKRLSSLSLPVCYFSLPGLLWLCPFCLCSQDSAEFFTFSTSVF